MLRLRQGAADDHALDVAGALVDLGDAGVAVEALDRVVLELAVAAVNLDRVRAHALGHLLERDLRRARDEFG